MGDGVGPNGGRLAEVEKGTKGEIIRIIITLSLTSRLRNKGIGFVSLTIENTWAIEQSKGLDYLYRFKCVLVMCVVLVLLNHNQIVLMPSLCYN